jgi:hypothetical protein
MFGNKYIKINTHIFSIDGIKAVTSNFVSFPDPRYQIYINYSEGSALCIEFEKQEELAIAISKLTKALKAK